MEDYNRLAERLDKIESSVERIERALLGDEYNKNAGVIHTISEHNQRLTALEQLVVKGKWLVIGLSATSGVGIYEVLKQIFNK